MKKLKKIIKRIITITVLLVVLIIILSIPAVQTIIAKKVTTQLNEDFGTDITIKRLGLNWKAEVDIREVYIADHHNDTLIYAKSLQTNILSIKNLLEGNLKFGFVDLEQTKFYLKTYKGEDNDNISIFADKFESDGPKSEKEFELFANNITFKDSKVKIIDEDLENDEIFNLSNINIKAKNLVIQGPNVATDIKKLSLNAKRGFEIKDLNAKFSYTDTNLSLKKMNLKTEGSLIKGDILLSYGDDGMSDFENSVIITAHLSNTKVSTNDLNAFYNEFAIGQFFDLTGTIDGTLNDFTFSDAQIKNNDILVIGEFVFKELLNENIDFRIKANNHKIKANYHSLRLFMPRILGNVIPDVIRDFGIINLNGNTTISASKLTTKSTLSCSLGYAKTDLEITNINDIEKASYVGDILLTEFDIGAIAKTESLETITSDLHIEGEGFTLETVNTEITGTITSFIFEGYDYRNISVSGNLKKPLFNGELNIDDPNIKMNFKGLVKVSELTNQFDFEADISFAELNKLKLVERDSISVFAGKIIMRMNGKTVDNTYGSISFKETFYQNENEYFYFDDFNITSQKEGIKRLIEINSPDIITGKISGEFLIKDIPHLFKNAIGSIYTNYNPMEVTTDQYIDYDFRVHNKIVDVFVPEIQFGDNTRIRGSVFSDESKFKLDFHSPEIIVFDNYLGKVKFQVDNDNPLFNTYVSIDSMYNGFYNLKEVEFINKTINDTLYIRSTFRGGKKKEDLFDLSLYHTINPEGKSVVGVKKSDIAYKDNIWHLNEKNNKLNKIVFDNDFKTIRFDSIVLSHNNKIIQFAGSMNNTTYKNLKIHFKDVNIGNITPFVDSLKLDGNVNGSVSVIQKDGEYFPTSSVSIDNISINDISYGDLNISIEGNKNLTKYDLNATLINENIKSIDIDGHIDSSTNNTKLMLNIDLNDFNLMAISPFGGDVITDIRGLTSGSVQITGNINSPDILGNFTLKNSGLKIPYLNIDFDLDDKANIIITKNKLELLESHITDTEFKTIGLLSGYATHTNFGDWNLDFDISTDNLLVLNTKASPDQLYYGTAFIKGTATIKGPVDELVIDVVASTEKNTVFKIPLSDTESIGDESLIKFLSPNEKEARLRGEDIVSERLKGLSLNFDLDINRNAEVEIVIDQINKSALRGRGAGTLLLEINTLGKFNMWGDFIVYEGIYDFRYGKIIRKEIAVERDGTITWSGIASNAELNLRAIYKTKANPSVLLDDPTINRKIPVEVIIDLTDKITQPELIFDIDFPEVSSTVQSELDYKLQTKEDREKQALFLITTGSFISDVAWQNAISGTLTEGFNAILAELLADEDAIINIAPYYDVGVNTIEIETQDEIGVQFSSHISERIIINGKVGIPVGGVNETRVAGDVDVQWLVNEEGNLRVNFFNRQAKLQFIGQDQIFEQGAGISYFVDFNTMKELIKKFFGTDIELESENNIVPDDNDAPVNFTSKTKKEEN